MYAIRLLRAHKTRLTSVVAAKKLPASSSWIHTRPNPNATTSSRSLLLAAPLRPSGSHHRAATVAGQFANLCNGSGNVNTLPSRQFCSSKPDRSDDGHDPADYQAPASHLPATVAVPEVWPHLPVIATRRNPVFPRFMKIIEVRVVFWFCVKTEDSRKSASRDE